MRQEEEERDRSLGKAQAEKEKRSLEYQAQVEREKKGVSQLPGLQSAIQGLMGGIQAQAAQARPRRTNRHDAARAKSHLRRNSCVTRTFPWKRPSPNFRCCRG